MSANDNPKPGTRGSDIPHHVDVHVGEQLRLHRTAEGMTQGQLGDKIGLSFQQIQKYENGKNRISSSKLYDISKILRVPITKFFEGLDMVDEDDIPDEIKLHRRQTMEMSRTLGQIDDPAMRKNFIDMAWAFVDSQNAQKARKVAAE